MLPPRDNHIEKTIVHARPHIFHSLTFLLFQEKFVMARSRRGLDLPIGGRASLLFVCAHDLSAIGDARLMHSCASCSCLVYLKQAEFGLGSTKVRFRLISVRPAGPCKAAWRRVLTAGVCKATTPPRGPRAQR